MSKSMNKYHKCIQELGKLPGWVKVGALAVGVGVGGGGWSPSDGQYARAGKYKVQIKSQEPVESGPSGWVDFEVMDENTGVMGSCRWFVEQRNRAITVTKSKNLNRVKGKLCLRSYCDLQLEVGGGSFAQLPKFDNRLSVKGGTKSDILHITSDREIFVPKDEVLQARELVVEDTLFNAEGGLDCCTVCFLRLKRPSHMSCGGALM